ncbi:hypothetical protein H1230_13245 [Paenibacillus sp. 19GGS1-52]|uniref:hypothetical protein n=1 Tax=Paenibacillus sp. 19GGS1-52 TaxID=2758563 RepID=UPI001EFBE8DF|nr:hypothetical protein [Paenibacillus sp. 19GGS1-52]ULO09646.1 hypothetical protein H1230_13245 [Paenibacillus sp. 19GGS1-52]
MKEQVRKTVQVYESTKERLQEIKTELGLSNESDVITYLINLYENCDSIPKETQAKLIQLLK